MAFNLVPKYIWILSFVVLINLLAWFGSYLCAASLYARPGFSGTEKYALRLICYMSRFALEPVSWFGKSSLSPFLAVISEALLLFTIWQGLGRYR